MIPIRQSATVAMSARALAKKAAGERVYNLSAGEPMVDIHPSIAEAAIKAIHDGKTHYPPVRGIPELRDAFSHWMHSSYGAHYSPENILVTCGGKFGIYVLCQMLLGKSDEAIVISPYWVSYPEIVKLFGGVPVVVETRPENDWKVDPTRLQHAITSKTKLLFFNNASNPTGTLYSREEIEEILRIATSNNLIVVSDEVYSGLVYDGAPFVSCGSFSEYQDRVVIIQSCSKHFAMTGFRVGFVTAQKHIIDTLAIIQSQSTTGTSSTSQWAAVAAFQHAQDAIASICKPMQSRRDVLVSELSKTFHREFRSPQSGLYLFPSIAELGLAAKPSADVSEDLLEQHNIATVPGSAFGQEGYIRLSFGETETELKDAVVHFLDAAAGA